MRLIVECETDNSAGLTRRHNSFTPPSDAITCTSAPIVAASQHLLQTNGSISGADVAQAILPQFPNLLSALPTSNEHAALASIDGRQAITHTQIHTFIQQTGRVLHDKCRVGRGHRVAVILPNGPELALAILAITSWASCVPLNAFGAAQELAADVQNAAVDLVIGMHDNPMIAQLANNFQMPFCGLVPDQTYAGLFTLQVPLVSKALSPRRAVVASSPSSEADRSAGNVPVLQHAPSTVDTFLPNQHEDEVLVLFTSGTTGQKKLVPHLLSDLLVATSCIAVSWKLTPADTNCNLMPLFHVGGIIRQVFSPTLSGGCVICCPSFDPSIFWQLLTSGTVPVFTWYYAAPTMHQLILQTGKAEGFITVSSTNNATATVQQDMTTPRLRMIANAAGGLLPSLARELRQTFGANVLPSYGMTECMPITSPPATYQLEKPGTSGVAVGPELAIMDIQTMKPLQAGKEGPICVRSQPCFRGYGVLYGGTSREKPETFLPGGWFNTGDLGYMDMDGFLYITGRSKEVINRGGEIISPMEVEEAINGHPDVLACVAFSTKHSVLQEVVGLLLVPAPNRPRLDLNGLHEYLGQGRLAAPKWPQCLVYMDNGIPKSHTNKLLRVKLGHRLSLPELNDSMYAIERTFQAKCPPQGTPVSVAIPCESVQVKSCDVQAVLREALVTQPHQQELMVAPHPSKPGALVAYVLNIDRMAVVRVAKEKLDAYAIPGHVCCLNGGMPGSFTEYDLTPPQPSDAIASILQEESSRGSGPADPVVMELQELMQMLLDLDCLPAPSTNFFNLGGSSMLASQLASRIRKLHGIPFGGAEIFHFPTCNDIAGVIHDRRGDGPGHGTEGHSSAAADPASQAASSLFSKQMDLSQTPFDPSRIDRESGLGATLFQLIPLFIIYPAWQMIRFFLFFRCLLYILQLTPGDDHIFKFVLTLVCFHSLWVTFTPLFFVFIKWTVIGRYEKGRFPIWGDDYLRWWFVDVMRKLIGRGVWGSNYKLLNAYYRMLGANIGRDARISLEADVAEYDLVTVGEGAAIEYCTLRGFGVDNGCMLLGPVTVGKFSSVGARSVVAPHTEIPDGAHLGPVSASYEIKSSPFSSSDHIQYNRQALPEPFLSSQVLVVGPITFFVSTLSHMPALAILYWMLAMPWHHDEPFNTLGDLMEWLCDIRRIPFFIGIRIARATVAPFAYMFGAILVKWLVIGKFREGPRDTTSEWELIRHELATTLFSRQNMQEVTELLGRHYELVSILYRLLGAKVGKRVFWPGHQPVFSGEFDLLEVGDDVVFGSRSSIFCTTTHSLKKVILCAGSNVADNTVVLPGSILGKNAVLGSNTVCPAGRYLPESSVWFGARGGEPVLLEKGTEDASRPIMASEKSYKDLPMDGDESTSRPFGRALYGGEADYFVYPIWFIVLFTLFSRVLVACLHALPLLGALHLCAGYFYGWEYSGRDYYYDTLNIPVTSLLSVLLGFFVLTHAVSVGVWFAIEVFSKWLLIGKREEGRYNYDSSSYCQKWELYQIVNRVRFNGRMNTMDFLSGTPMMTAFFRALGLKVGKNCCLYPAGGDPYMPEPDLVKMGDRCVVDCSSIVCHLNTRGNFELAKITLENNTTLRTRSRIQQGVHMESNSMLLEKSLVMTGEIIEADSIWVGAPAARLLSYDTSSMNSMNLSYHGSNGGGAAGPSVFV